MYSAFKRLNSVLSCSNLALREQEMRRSFNQLQELFLRHWSDSMANKSTLCLAHTPSVIRLRAWR